jgi:hypothetical protein
MKSFHLPSVIVATLALTFSACEKNEENISNVSELKAASSSKVVYPIIGTDTSGRILPWRKLPRAVLRKTDIYPDNKVQLIDTVCADYLNETQKFNPAYIAEGSITYIVRHANNTLIGDPDVFNYGFKKLSSGANGWWAHWNYSPYTESENPVVLLVVNRRVDRLSPENSMSIGLANYVKTFGFEIAPNGTGKDFKVLVTYNDFGSYRGRTMFTVEQTISSPSGARLIAVKSSEPFDYINIELQGDPYPSQGFAIANIRYELAY